MTINILQAAKHLCEKSEWRLTRLEVQKIIYLAHVWYLGKNEQPLVEGDFEAWPHGPVNVELFYFSKKSKSRELDKKTFGFVKDLDEETNKNEIEALNYLFDSCSPVDGWELVDVTHWKGGAWVKNFDENKPQIIPLEDIRAEGKARLALEEEKC